MLLSKILQHQVDLDVYLASLTCLGGQESSGDTFGMSGERS